MQFEWDEAKNEANVTKHGVSFELAAEIFYAPVFSLTDSRRDYGEMRTISIGQVSGVLILAVVHADRSGRRRIISARRASRAERSDYDQAIAEADQHG